jgi:ABC-type transporter Mla MlaB component
MSKEDRKNASVASSSPRRPVRKRGKFHWTPSRQIAKKRKTHMLRTTVTENASEQRWALQGRLVKDCLPELISAWKDSRSQSPDRVRVVDLNQVTSIDKEGEEVLRMMIRDGAEFVTKGLYTKHLLDAIRVHRADFE